MTNKTLHILLYSVAIYRNGEQNAEAVCGKTKYIPTDSNKLWNTFKAEVKLLRSGCFWSDQTKLGEFVKYHLRLYGPDLAR